MTDEEVVVWMKDMKQRVGVALRGLGASAKSVATVLELRGIKGIQHHTASCPIAMYLRERIEGVQIRVLGATAILIKDGAIYRPFVQEESQRQLGFLPTPVRKFIRAFDRGEFPELSAD